MDEKIEQKLKQVDCTDLEIGDQLLPYLHGHVSGKEQLRIKEHLLSCKACQEELRFLRAVTRVQQEDFAIAALAFLRQHA
jgi:hypothetical protein